MHERVQGHQAAQTMRADFMPLYKFSQNNSMHYIIIKTLYEVHFFLLDIIIILVFIYLYSLFIFHSNNNNRHNQQLSHFDYIKLLLPTLWLYT